MAYRKASEEKAAAALGSEDFWAAVQNGADVRVSVADILTYLRATLRTSDIAELPGKLQAISDAAAGDLSAAVDQIDAVLGQLDGSVSDKLDALQADVNSRVSSSRLGAGPNLVPVLDDSGKLDVSTIPAVAITDTFPVSSQADMLALTAERGDIAIRSDLNKCFVLKAEPASTLANWKELLTPTDAVLSVVGLTGAITASALKAALGIAVSDVANLQASLDALSAADTKIRTDFAAADTAEAKARSDADTAEATARANAVTAEAKARADADAALEAKKANLTGGSFTGGIAVKANAASGSVGLAGGSDTRTGYVEFRNADGSRMGYVGWGTGTTIEITAEAGIHFDFNSQPTVAGNGVWHAGNFDPNTKLDKTGGTISGGLTVNGVLTLPRNGTGDNISFGDDVLIGDVNVGNALGIKGIGDAKQGYIALGGTKKRFGFDGGNMIAEVGGNLYVKPDAASVFYGVWHEGNFTPSTKANLAGATFTGDVSAPNVYASAAIGLPASAGTNNIKVGSGDGGSLATHNVRMHLHWGLGIEDYAGTVRGVYDARAGVWNTLGVPQVNGSPVWYPGNFDPGTKVNRGGDTLSSQFIFQGGTGGTIASRTGDGSILQVKNVDGGAAAMTFHRSGQFASWFGLDTDNEYRRGGWSEGGSWKFWTEKNFNPGTKADLNATVRFNGVLLGNSEGYIYGDAGSNNAVIRTGASNAYRYSIFASDGFFTSGAGMRANGDVYATGRMIVGEGQNQSYIEMRDTDNYTRYLHNNDGSIGFLGGDGGWKFRVFDDGNWWTPTYGYMSDVLANINNRISRYGDTMTGDLTITKSYPTVTLLWGNVYRVGLQLREDARTYLMELDTGNAIMSVGPGGDIWTRQIGDLNSRIENRINNKSARLAYAGEINVADVGTSALWEGTPGGVVTGFQQNGNTGYPRAFRMRSLQMSNSNGDYYTCGYV